MPDINLEDFQESILVRPIRTEDYDQIAELQLKSFFGHEALEPGASCKPLAALPTGAALCRVQRKDRWIFQFVGD